MDYFPFKADSMNLIIAVVSVVGSVDLESFYAKFVHFYLLDENFARS